MADARNLPNPQFSLLEPNERFALIRTLRAARRVVPEKKIAKAKATTAATKKTRAQKKPLTGDLAGLTAEQLTMLMEMLNAAD